MLHRILRFVGVGGLATLVHVATALVAERMVGLGPQQANLAGFGAAVMASYFGHARFTFEVDPRSAGQFLRFAVVALLGLATSSGIVWLVTGRLGLGFGLAMAVVAVAVPAITFIAAQFWVFARRETGGADQWQGVALAAVAALGMLALFWGRSPSDDVVWYLIATREWLGGARLYEMVIEVNPPLNFYFTAPAILLADLFGISDRNGQYVLSAAILFASLVWCASIVRGVPGLSHGRQLALLAGVAVAMVVPALDSIGQREHMLVMLMMPWLLGQLAVPRPTARDEVPRAFVAALGMCLKPHFVLFPIAVTLVRMVRDRSIRPVLSAANLTFLAVGLAYIGMVALVHPLYLTEIVPMASQVYGAYRVPPGLLLSVAYPVLLLILLPVVIGLMNRADRIGPGIFGAAAAAGLATYVLQGTGFGYHLIPLKSFALVACVLILLRAGRQSTFAVATAVTALGLAGLSIKHGFPRYGAMAEVSSVADRLGDFDSMMTLGSSLFSGPPVALATEARWTSRYPANWLVPGAMRGLERTDCAVEAETCASLRAIAARNRSDNIADLRDRQPDLVIVERNSFYFPRAGFDWLAFMAEDPAWVTAFARYDQVAETRRFLFFKRAR